MMDEAKSDIDMNISSIHPYIANGAKLVGIDQSGKGVVNTLVK